MADGPAKVNHSRREGAGFLEPSVGGIRRAGQGTTTYAKAAGSRSACPRRALDEVRSILAKGGWARFCDRGPPLSIGPEASRDVVRKDPPAVFVWSIVSFRGFEESRRAGWHSSSRRELRGSGRAILA